MERVSSGGLLVGWQRYGRLLRAQVRRRKIEVSLNVVGKQVCIRVSSCVLALNLSSWH